MSSPTSNVLVLDQKISKKSASIQSFGVHFVPKDPRQITFGRKSIMVYPKITPDMPMSEKAHAFNVNRAAIDSSSLSTRSKLLLMGSLHNADTIVNVNKMEW